MGKGKSSVIMPLLTMKCILNNNTKQINNILLLMPNHLTKDSFNSIINIFSIYFNPYNTNIMTGKMTMIKDNIKDFFKNDYKNIFITDDISLKSFRLNSMKNIPSNRKYLDIIRWEGIFKSGSQFLFSCLYKTAFKLNLYKYI